MRSTGSGMGCPDWPRCFDRVIPPTHVSQLPADYQERYIERRIKKNARFSETLDFLGFAKLAQELREDKSILQPEIFNPAKTWTEYVNRLIGALSGVLLFTCAAFSITYLKSKKRIFFLSVFNLFLVVFQAWLGSIVVSTNLVAWIVTVHMLVALAILAICIYTYFSARVLRDRQLLANKSAKNVRLLTIVALCLSIIQIVLGTEVREIIDAVSSRMHYLNRSEWVENVGVNYLIHSNLALVILIINIVILVLMRRTFLGNSPQFRYIVYIFFLLLGQTLTGLTLSYLALPPAAQAIHILLASMVFGAQFYLLLLLKQNSLYKLR